MSRHAAVSIKWYTFTFKKITKICLLTNVKFTCLIVYECESVWLRFYVCAALLVCVCLCVCMCVCACACVCVRVCVVVLVHTQLSRCWVSRWTECPQTSPCRPCWTECILPMKKRWMRHDTLSKVPHSQQRNKKIKFKVQKLSVYCLHRSKQRCVPKKCHITPQGLCSKTPFLCVSLSWESNPFTSLVVICY